MRKHVPLYVYSCPDCDVLVEELRPVGMTDWPPVECPVCKGLCEQEITNVTIGGRARPMSGFIAQPETNSPVEPDPVGVLHGPGCPCCRTV
jgi:putative FmdB family regulatory protein